jgi:hypothetical protein
MVTMLLSPDMQRALMVVIESVLEIVLVVFCLQELLLLLRLLSHLSAKATAMDIPISSCTVTGEVQVVGECELLWH